MSQVDMLAHTFDECREGQRTDVSVGHIRLCNVASLMPIACNDAEQRGC